MHRPAHESPHLAGSGPRVSEERFRAMVGDQRPALTRYALALTLGDRHAAEDLVQEAMVRAWRSDHLPHGEADTRRWLFTVTRRLFIDDFRRRRVRPAEVAATTAFAEEDGSALVVAGQALREAAGRLSDTHREVLFQIFYEDRSVGEVAHRLGVPEGTVRSRVHYALRTLREAVR